MKLPSILCAGFLVLCTPSTGLTQAQQVFTRGDITQTHSVDWGVLGPVLTTPSNPFVLDLGGGLNMTTSAPAGASFVRYDEGPSFSSYFAFGEQLLSVEPAGPVNFVFNDAIHAFGFELVSLVFGSFDASISAFDASDNLLGTFTQLNAQSNSNLGDGANGTPTFLGIESTTGILRVTVDVEHHPVIFETPPYIDAFVFNRLSIDQGAFAAPIPEPETYAMLLAGLVLLGFATRKRRMTAAA
jgi:hypothetical protein